MGHLGIPERHPENDWVLDQWKCLSTIHALFCHNWMHPIVSSAFPAKAQHFLGLPRCKNLWSFSLFYYYYVRSIYLFWLFCFLCSTSLMNVTGFYPEDWRNKQNGSLPSIIYHSVRLHYLQSKKCGSNFWACGWNPWSATIYPLRLHTLYPKCQLLVVLCMNNEAVYFPTFISRGNSQQIAILTRLLIKGFINCWKVLEKFFILYNLIRDW